MTITLHFANGRPETLAHHDPEQIAEWLGLLGSPEAMKECGILAISTNYSPGRPSF